MQNSRIYWYLHIHTPTYTPQNYSLEEWVKYVLPADRKFPKEGREDGAEMHVSISPSKLTYVIPTPLGKNEWGSKERFWPPDTKNWLIRKSPNAQKGWRKGEKGTTEDETVGWYHWLNGHEFEQALGVGDGQGSLACYSPWGHKESNKTEQLNWTELIVPCWHKSLQHGRKHHNTEEEIPTLSQERGLGESFASITTEEIPSKGTSWSFFSSLTLLAFPPKRSHPFSLSNKVWRFPLFMLSPLVLDTVKHFMFSHLMCRRGNVSHWCFDMHFLYCEWSWPSFHTLSFLICVYFFYKLMSLCFPLFFFFLKLSLFLWLLYMST